MAITSRQAREAHRNIAWFLLIFVGVHFATHFVSIGGIEAHTKALGWARMVYQWPLVEVALVLAFAAQVALGIKLLTIIRRRKGKGFWHWVQFISACYLAYFIVAHTAAALVTRLGIGLDTNYYWAAGTLQLDPIRYYFAPYYVLAVAALVSHLVAALHFRGERRWHVPALAIGPAVGVCFVLGFGSAFETMVLPPDYIEFYAQYLGAETASAAR